MRALVIREHASDPASLAFEDRPEPEPGPGQVRVRIHAVALNHLATWVRRGLPGHRFPLPIVPGSDGAGVIDAVGEGCASKLAGGDRVVVAPGFGCGLCGRCAGGQEQLCRGYGILGETCDGTNQELICLDEARVLRIPDHLDLTAAAAVPLVFLTAWHMLISRCGVTAGQTVLVHAAGSGVSSAAIQIADLAGCTVLATASSDHKLALATRGSFMAPSKDWPLSAARPAAGRRA